LEEASTKKIKVDSDSVYNAKAGFAVINSGNAIMKAMGLKL